MSFFGNILNKILLASSGKVEGDFKSYIKKIENGDFRDEFCYGISDDKKGFFTLDPVKSPGALYCGGMGSGKSVAMLFTVMTHLVSNSDQTFYILVDAEKGMNDYKDLFKYKKNVVTALDDTAKVVPVIDMVYQEMMKRKELFSNPLIQANNIYYFEEIAKNPELKRRLKEEYNIDLPSKMARIVICFEEFHSIPNSKVINFPMKVDREGSVANKLKVLMRTGRSYGICVLAATQRATSDDFPTTLKPGISQMMAFRTKNPGDASIMNLPHAEQITNDYVGRCAYEGGFLQFPYFPKKEDPAKFLDKYYKPLDAAMLAYTAEDYHEALSGEGNDGMVNVKPLLEILENKEQFNINAITGRFLKTFGYEILPQENDALAISLLAKKGDEKIAVMVLTDSRIGKKRIDAFVEGAKILDCSRAIVFGYGGLPREVNENSVSLKKEGLMVDPDDLRRIAEVMDNKGKLEIAGKFDQLYQKLVLVESEPQVKEDPKVDESINDLLEGFQGLIKEEPGEKKNPLDD